jgi:hypothetical protein
VVRWPSGIIETHGSVAANTALHLVEGGPLTAVVERSAATAVAVQMVLAEAYPNPFNASVVLPFDLPSVGPVRLQIYNVLGQSVRTLIDGQVLAAGPHHVIWTGLDQAGHPLASGVYYAHLQAFTESRVRSLVLSR